MRLLLGAIALVGLIRCGQGPAREAAPALGGAGSGPSIDGGVSTSGGAGSASDGGTSASSDAGSSDAGASPGWVVAAREDFQSLSLPDVTWQVDSSPDDGPFSDDGLYFQKQDISPPPAFRASVPFGAAGWLTAESYTRKTGAFSDRFSVVADPADANNKVLRIASPLHTDATVVRPTQPLPGKYRVSLRVGFADFGDGRPGGLNGYAGGETPAPWLSGDATQQNGFYWLTILDSQPRPHNSVWIHHHRKVVMDSDNNVPPWMEIWDGKAFRLDGEHPLMMFAIDGKQDAHDLYGPPFLSWSAGAWQPSGTIRAVDQYLAGEWYRASIERDGDDYTLEVSGRFANGGQTTYRATIGARANCVWHFNNSADAASCANPRSSAALGPGYPYWPAGGSWADWFMFGDPHENFYRGSVLYDDVQLEVLR
jgi:hypothetical protein